MIDLRTWLNGRPRLRDASYWAAVLARDLRGLFASSASQPVSPTDIGLEPSNLCNANCVFCAYQHQTRPHQSVDLRLAFRVIDQARAAGVERLCLTPTVGDPLVNRELESIIQHARREPTPLKVGLTTNGILLSKKRYLSLLDAGVTVINISMTYPDADEYERIYRNSSYKTLIRNIEDILDVYRPEHCRVNLHIRSGRAGLLNHPLLEKARAAGWALCPNVFFDDWSGSVGEGIRSNGLAVRPLRPKRLPCAMLYSGPHFFSDGRASACGCRDLDGKSELGLAAEALLEDLPGAYRTGVIEGLREKFRAGSAPAVCQSCRHYTPHFAKERVRTRLAQTGADGVAAVRYTLGLKGASKSRPRRKLEMLAQD